MASAATSLASGDGPAANNDEMPIEAIFDTRRFLNGASKCFMLIYAPIAIGTLILRVFVGFHVFVVACLLRKTTILRSVVLRIMCSILGLVVIDHGKRDQKAKVLVANHVSILDHTAIDLVSPCLLPSIWDIPSVIRWCFGYVDLGASRGRTELVRQAKDLVEREEFPLLAFPEGIITSGNKALLKFNSWCFEISDSVQPIAVKAWRPNPFKVAVSEIGASWWTDLVCFFIIPFTIIHVTYLPTVHRREQENVEEYAERVSGIIAGELGIETSKFDTSEASEAIKRWKKNKELEKSSREANGRQKSTKLVSSKQLDVAAMRIKQSMPGFHLLAIRKDLERTKNQAATLENLKMGKIAKVDLEESGKVTLDASSWRAVFDCRKWEMIETNRTKYLQREA
ncbi:unnamed protein product [Caenorhabditis bovis]|uniref:CUE domain-containing protein n=1 Tax=Caenorhabditis bovis TaxID=2654633 RepID=A0A8S1EV96_9PELO|nr:unnamed protein product [Caenorhabditis bovis]